MERAKAEADYNESGTKIDIAKNERDQAILSEKSAAAEKKAADGSNDLTRINAASAEMRRAELARKAADEKVSWLNADRGYLKKWLRYTTENMYAAEAKFELAKARVAQQRNIRPPGFELGRFEKQNTERSERAQRERAKAMQEKEKSDARRKQWESMRGAASPPADVAGDGS
jgi:hypothetical protein